MQVTGEEWIGAPPERVWAALNDPEILKRSVPGCESLERLTDSDLKAVAMVRVGPVRARFQGRVTLSDVDAPNGYRITGEGEGGAAGFAKGGATVRLVPDGDGTRLSYTVDATIGGRLAQLGSRLVDETARKMAREFFASFSDALAEPPSPALVAEAETAPPAPLPAQHRGHVWRFAVAAAVAAVVLCLVFLL